MSPDHPSRRHQPLTCPACQSQRTRRNGRDASGSQKVYCLDCKRHFRRRYRHKAHHPQTTQRIDKLTDQGLSVRAIAAKLQISATTVQNTRKALQRHYKALIRQPFPVANADLHVICWSGGKDSSALLVWAKEHLLAAKTKIIFCDTGWEAPATYQFIEEVNQRLLGGSLITLKSQKYEGLPDLSQQRDRFPSPKARFCTTELKIIPTIAFLLQQTGHIAVYQGIRAGESVARARMRSQDDYFVTHLLYDQEPTILVDGEVKRRRRPAHQAQVMTWLETNDCTVHRPFFHWKTVDVLALCRKHNVLNPLYEVGFSRVGCFPCIMENKAGLRALATYAPERVDLIAKLESDTGHTFFPHSKVPNSQCREPGIYDVIKWACTGFGGAHDEGGHACMSHFAQCE